MQVEVHALKNSRDIFIASKETIIKQWLSYKAPREILHLHKIDERYFLDKYASGVFDYFMDVISGDVQIGRCPVMQELMLYLKNREISADELFAICSHFRHAMINFSYDAGLNSQKIFNEMAYIFDENFRGILKYYTDTLFQKLIDARQEALYASQAKEYFLSNMSHEIRTPLNAILGFVNLLLDEDLLKKHRNYLEIIHNSGENLLSIINDILDFSKLRSGEFTIEKKPFSLHEELSHTMELFVASANAKDITITSYIEPTIPVSLYGDALRIKQILSNFLSNAIKFTPESGIIQVEVSFENGILTMHVIDNGMGIKNKDIKNIFSAFAQAEHSMYTYNEGTGLGLSICNQLAQKMGGEIGVDSTEGSGSDFFVKLPTEVHLNEQKEYSDISDFQKLRMVVYAHDKVVGYKHDSFIRYAEMFFMNIEVVDTLDGEFDICIFVYEECDESLKKQIINSGKKFVALMSGENDYFESYQHVQNICFPLYCSKMYMAFSELLNPQCSVTFAHMISKKYKGHILIVEDNEANQELIMILLAKYGLTFDLAKNGLEGLELFKRNQYDLVLMDEQMPVMNGNEAVKHIKEFEEYKGVKHTPISALTANVLKDARKKGLLSGFDAYLGKPIVLQELEKVFSQYLKAATCIKPNNIQIESEAQERIVGLDTEKLCEALMLTHEELLMLLKLFLSKMVTTLADLKSAISKKDYEKIALLAHSIKGSSGNFRMNSLQEFAANMEEMAKKRDEKYRYEACLTDIQTIIASISIES